MATHTNTHFMPDHGDGLESSFRIDHDGCAFVALDAPDAHFCVSTSDPEVLTDLIAALTDARAALVGSQQEAAA